MRNYVYFYMVRVTVRREGFRHAARKSKNVGYGGLAFRYRPAKHLLIAPRYYAS